MINQDGTQTLNDEIEKILYRLSLDPADPYKIRVPSFLSEDFFNREHHFLTQRQVNFIRSDQLNAMLRKCELKSQLYSYRNCPHIFEKNGLKVLIGINGQAVAFYENKKGRLGVGGFGVVYVGQNVDTGQFCAVKRYNGADEEYRDSYVDEVYQLAQEDRLVDSLSIPIEQPRVFYSIQTLVWGENLSDHLIFLDNEVFSKRMNYQQYFTELLDIYIESLGAIYEFNEIHKRLHRDIKASNIIWDSQTRKATLVDLGCAAALDENYKVIDEFVCTTHLYAAPELFLHENYYNLVTYRKSSEVYAAGVLGCELFDSGLIKNCVTEHVRANIIEQFKSISEEALPPHLKNISIFRGKKQSALQSCVYDILKRMVNRDRTVRPEIKDVLVALKNLRNILEGTPSAEQKQLEVLIDEALDYDSVLTHLHLFQKQNPFIIVKSRVFETNKIILHFQEIACDIQKSKTLQKLTESKDLIRLKVRIDCLRRFLIKLIEKRAEELSGRVKSAKIPLTQEEHSLDDSIATFSCEQQQVGCPQSLLYQFDRLVISSEPSQEQSERKQRKPYLSISV